MNVHTAARPFPSAGPGWYPAGVGRDRPPLVYSTEGPVCAGCRRLQASCRCPGTAPAPLPPRPKVVLRLERKGRAGKSVTVVDGLPPDSPALRDLAAELKRACGTGGTVSGGSVELQGDQRDRLRALLRGRGWVVRG